MYLSTWGTRILTANVHIHITAFHRVSFPYHKNHTGERNYCACSPGQALGDLVSSFQTTFSKKKTQNTYQILVFYSNVVNLTYSQSIDNLFSPLKNAFNKKWMWFFPYVYDPKLLQEPLDHQLQRDHHDAFQSVFLQSNVKSVLLKVLQLLHWLSAQLTWQHSALL